MLTNSRWEIFILSFYLYLKSYAEFIEECGDRESIYIKSNQGCSFYTFCYGEDSFTAECDEDTPYFSANDQTCDANPEVCDEIVTKPSEVTEEQTEVSTQVQTSTKAINANTTTIFPPLTSTPLNSLTSTTAFPGISSTSTTVQSSHLATECPLQDNPQQIIFLANNKSCSSYFMCYHGEALAMECTNALHFDPATQKCDYPDRVKCQLDTTSAREKCHARAFGAFSYPSNCNYYYLCRFGYLMVMQCPQNSDWDGDKRACMRRGQAKCKEGRRGTAKGL